MSQRKEVRRFDLCLREVWWTSCRTSIKGYKRFQLFFFYHLAYELPSLFAHIMIYISSTKMVLAPPIKRHHHPKTSSQLLGPPHRTELSNMLKPCKSQRAPVEAESMVYCEDGVTSL